MQFGGRVNKQFFSTHGPRHGRERVSQLIDSHGDLQTDPNVVMDIATYFYASLLIADAPSHATVEATDAIWQCIPVLVDTDKHGLLDSPFTNSEFRDALFALHKGKCPSLNGLTPSFLISLWDNIGDDVTLALEDIWDTCVVRDFLIESLIHLIPKGCCRNLIS